MESQGTGSGDRGQGGRVEPASSPAPGGWSKCATRASVRPGVRPGVSPDPVIGHLPPGPPPRVPPNRGHSCRSFVLTI
jgi:hypothetical protein